MKKQIALVSFVILLIAVAIESILSPGAFGTWNGADFSYPSEIFYPSTEQEIREIVQRARAENTRIRVTGRDVHTWGRISIADEDTFMVNMREYRTVLAIDTDAKTVTAQAGAKMEEIVRAILPHDLALINMGTTMEQSVAGATATGTHGSGGSTVDGMEFKATTFSEQAISFKYMDLTENANVHVVSLGDEDYDAFLVHLGSLGIILEVTLQLRDKYYLQREGVSLGPLANFNLNMIEQKLATKRHVTYYLSPWRDDVLEGSYGITDNTFESEEGPADFQNSLREFFFRITHLAPWLGAQAYAIIIRDFVHGLTGSDIWWQVLSQVDSIGGFNVLTLYDSEYTCTFDKTLEAVDTVFGVMRQADWWLSYFLYLRFSWGSPGLMSMNHGEPTQRYVHVSIQGHSTTRYPRYLYDQLEQVMGPLGCRPHWGKYNINARDFIRQNNIWPEENVARFTAVKMRNDPDNILGNEYMDIVLGL